MLLTGYQVNWNVVDVTKDKLDKVYKAKMTIAKSEALPVN